jgi:hypothetical protein
MIRHAYHERHESIEEHEEEHHGDTATQRRAHTDSAGRPATQADEHGRDRTERRTGESRSGSYLGPTLVVPPLRGARRIDCFFFVTFVDLRAFVVSCR